MKKLNAYIPEPVSAKLEDWAKSEDRSVSSLVAFLLETAIRERDRELRAEREERLSA
jgi:hypothetical protein